MNGPLKFWGKGWTNTKNPFLEHKTLSRGVVYNKPNEKMEVYRCESKIKLIIKKKVSASTLYTFPPCLWACSWNYAKLIGFRPKEKTASHEVIRWKKTGLTELSRFFAIRFIVLDILCTKCILSVFEFFNIYPIFALRSIMVCPKLI